MPETVTPCDGDTSAAWTSFGFWRTALTTVVWPIASVGSACSLVVFLLVGVAGYRLRSETGAEGAIVLLGAAVTIVVLAFFAVDTLRNAPQTFAAMVVILVLAVALDTVWKRFRPSEPFRDGQASLAGGS